MAATERRDALLARYPSLRTVALAGGLAGVAVDAILYPLDTIKTRLQARPVAAAGGVPLQLPAAVAGWRSFYRGGTSSA